jgi:hypothetical protein
MRKVRSLSELSKIAKENFPELSNFRDDQFKAPNYGENSVATEGAIFRSNK